MTIGVVRSEWSGTLGGPGLTQMAISFRAGDSWSASDAQSAVDAVRTFWDALKAHLPNEVSITVNPQVDQFDQSSGLLTGTTTAGTPPLVVAGLGSGVYSGGTGYRIDWGTNVIAEGRRVRGRTYIVPTIGSAYDNTGRIVASYSTTAKTAAEGLLSALSSAGGQLVVWSRPEVTGGSDGAIAGVSTPSVPLKGAILRSRRD